VANSVRVADPVQSRTPLIGLLLALAMLIGWLQLAAPVTIALVAVIVVAIALIAWRSRRAR
jgi:NADH:ubiquinone oxidoreductase subunit 6 (subunit J)